ncbi:MAG: hypothetical protein QM831_21480 [Kofleriaceae bacterium]
MADGGMPNENWFKSAVSAGPSAGSSADFKLKPGHYQFDVAACKNGTHDGDHDESNGLIEIRLERATHVILVTAGGQEPPSSQDPSIVVVRMTPWHRVTQNFCNHDQFGTCQ